VVTILQVILLAKTLTKTNPATQQVTNPTVTTASNILPLRQVKGIA
jgi:hypothetical protein